MVDDIFSQNDNNNNMNVVDAYFYIIFHELPFRERDLIMKRALTKLNRASTITLYNVQTRSWLMLRCIYKSHKLTP